MGRKQKKLSVVKNGQSKRLNIEPASSDNERIIFVFDSVDVSGEFSFVPSRADFNAQFVMEKIIEISKHTWIEIMTATHNDGKSCNHFLRNVELSKAADNRIHALRLDDLRDQIFSLRLKGKTRIIGIRSGAKFNVKWYDPEHEFCPSTK